jgi:hypothetical protein
MTVCDYFHCNAALSGLAGTPEATLADISVSEFPRSHGRRIDHMGVEANFVISPGRGMSRETAPQGGAAKVGASGLRDLGTVRFDLCIARVAGPHDGNMPRPVIVMIAIGGDDADPTR